MRNVCCRSSGGLFRFVLEWCGGSRQSADRKQDRQDSCAEYVIEYFVYIIGQPGPNSQHLCAESRHRTVSICVLTVGSVFVCWFCVGTRQLMLLLNSAWYQLEPRLMSSIAMDTVGWNLVRGKRTGVMNQTLSHYMISRVRTWCPVRSRWPKSAYGCKCLLCKSSGSEVTQTSYFRSRVDCIPKSWKPVISQHDMIITP